MKVIRSESLQKNPSLGLLTVGHTGSFEFMRRNTAPIDTVDDWTDCFVVFMSVYTRRFPHKYRDMLKYMYNIRWASRKYGDYGWRDYDHQFRMRQTRSPNASWAHYTLITGWCTCRPNRNAHNSQPSLFVPTEPRFENQLASITTTEVATAKHVNARTPALSV
jgi:hypothetical protein